ncbi:MAG TPA: HAMP domain-containing sensor histidine kinase, partial [Candidatus Obscuribacterales bacterium]
QLAEEEALKEARLKEIAANTQRLGRVLWECRRTLDRYIGTREIVYWNKYSELAAELPKIVDWLKGQKEISTDQRTLLLRIERKVTHCLSWLDRSRALVESMSPSDALIMLNDPHNKVVPIYHSLVNDIIELGKLMEHSISESPIAQQRLREVTRQLLIAGVIVNVLTAIAVSIVFTRNISDRLRIMVDNTRRLRESKELNPLMRGGDEIAVLDKSFHDMASELAEAQRMRQAFVAMISHELRTPLTSLLGFLSVMSMGAMGAISDQLKENAERMEKNVERLIRLINDLLDLERMDAGKMQMSPDMISLEGAVRRSLDAVKEFAEQNAIALSYEGKDVRVWADGDRLVQVLVNLLSNAIKFSPPESTVSIDVAGQDGYVEVRVIDQGRGIPQSHKEVIFERYKQVEAQDGSKKGGSGLGLPICRLIVEQLGGTIGVMSEAGQGSIFWFRLLSAPP